MGLNSKLNLRSTPSEGFKGKPVHKNYHLSKLKYTVTHYVYESIVFIRTVKFYFLQDLGSTNDRKFLYKCQITSFNIL